MTLLAGGACADDAPSLITDTDADTENGTSTGDIPPVTTIDPDSTGSGGGDATRGESSTTAGETEEGDTSTTTDPTTDGGGVCGNGTVEDGEECEAKNLGGEDCESQGFMGGELQCGEDCLFDTSECTDRTCGNGAIEGKEQCDGAELGGATCETEGFDAGRIACTRECALDTSGCMNVPDCGNGALDGGETCDGAALGGQTCVTQGFAGGTLGCAPDCGSFDTSACMMPPACGNGAIDGGEVCDGAALGGQTCVTQGFDAGTLACAVDCTSFDTSACVNEGGDCCAVHDGVGCDDAACEASVCALDPFCCATTWDAQCAGEATADPNCAGVGGSCPPPAGGGDCCAVHAGVGCDNAACEASVCALDPFCCATSWDAQCAGEATADPNCQGAGGSCPGGGGLACSDQNIGNATGPAVAAGTTVGADESLQPGCGAAGGPDNVMTWTATAAGIYTFDTFGSAYDTKLALYTDCATQLACNDDAAGGAQSQIAQNLAAGQQILIVVDGFNGATGNWTLNITPPGGGGFACQDQDLGSAIGNAIAMGTTVGQDNDLDPTCGAGNALDRVFRFQAPAAGQYTFNTNGSGYDTVMSLFSDCATQLACNDDVGGGPLYSQLVRNMAAGEVVLILVDGYNGATGNYVLNITSP